jgi:hypothetical protein
MSHLARDHNNQVNPVKGYSLSVRAEADRETDRKHLLLRFRRTCFGFSNRDRTVSGFLFAQFVRLQFGHTNVSLTTSLDVSSNSAPQCRHTASVRITVVPAIMSPMR